MNRCSFRRDNLSLPLSLIFSYLLKIVFNVPARKGRWAGLSASLKNGIYSKLQSLIVPKSSEKFEDWKYMREILSFGETSEGSIPYSCSLLYLPFLVWSLLREAPQGACWLKAVPPQRFTCPYCISLSLLRDARPLLVESGSRQAELNSHDQEGCHKGWEVLQSFYLFKKKLCRKALDIRPASLLWVYWRDPVLTLFFLFWTMTQA